jgi:DNA-binding transcriptional MerR regulator
MMADTPRLLTLLEVAAMLRLSPHTIRCFVRKGKLSPVRLCRRLLFRPADIERLIASASTARGEGGNQ